MGIRAMSWAMQQDLVSETNQQFVLIALSNWISDEDGDGAFPSVSTLCKVTRLSDSTVRRKLDELEKLGVIVRGNQALAAAYISRADRRPVVWAFPRLRPVTVTTRDVNDLSTGTERVVKQEETTSQALTTDPLRNPLRNPPIFGRASTFEEEFRKRFGVTPDAAHEQRKTK